MADNGIDSDLDGIKNTADADSNPDAIDLDGDGIIDGSEGRYVTLTVLQRLRRRQALADRDVGSRAMH